MTRFFVLNQFLAVLVFCLTSPLTQAQVPLRILFIGKMEEGKYHDPYARFLDAKTPLAANGINLVYLDNFTAITDSNLKSYDGVLVYTMHSDWGKGAEIGVIKRFVESGKGLIGLHTATYFSTNTEWVALIGAAFEGHLTGNPILLETILPTHPAIYGAPNTIPVIDETYFFFKNFNAADRIILQNRKAMPGARADAWTWVRTQGKGRVYYTAAGHNEPWRTAEFLTQLEIAIKWAAQKEAHTALDFKNFVLKHSALNKKNNARKVKVNGTPGEKTLKNKFGQIILDTH